MPWLGERVSCVRGGGIHVVAVGEDVCVLREEGGVRVVGPMISGETYASEG